MRGYRHYYPFFCQRLQNKSNVREKCLETPTLDNYLGYPASPAKVHENFLPAPVGAFLFLGRAFRLRITFPCPALLRTQCRTSRPPPPPTHPHPLTHPTHSPTYRLGRINNSENSTSRGGGRGAQKLRPRSCRPLDGRDGLGANARRDGQGANAPLCSIPGQNPSWDEENDLSCREEGRSQPQPHPARRLRKIPASFFATKNHKNFKETRSQNLTYKKRP